MKNMGQSILRRLRRAYLALYGVLIIASPVAVLSQSSPADPPWSGAIQCQLDVKQSGYSRHETQSWTLTDSTPIGKNGYMQIYQASWTVKGQGGIQRAQGPRASAAQWTINSPPANASIAMFVRASDGRFIIRVWQRPAPSYNAVRGIRQIAVNGVLQQSGSISSPVNEWLLPWIETTPDANISGKLSVPTEGLGADLTPVGASPAAECTWRFSKGKSVPESPEQNLPVGSVPDRTQTTSGAATAAAGSNLGSLRAAGNSPTPTQVATDATTTPSPDNTQTIDVGTQASATASPASPASPPPSFDRNSLPVERKTWTPRAAPTGFAAKPLGLGAVQFSWQPVSGASQYRFEGTGIASSGVYAGASSTGVTIQNVPPGPGTWKMAAVYGNNSWDPNLTATASAMVRYTPSHSVQWLSKSNGPGSAGMASRHYSSLCSTCLPGVNFATFLKGIGVLQSDLIWDGYAGGFPEALYMNVTEFGTSRATTCLPRRGGGFGPATPGGESVIGGLPFGRTLCYSKSGDHGMTVIVKQLGLTWFLTFTAPQPDADIFSYTLTDRVTLDSEGPKYSPHACLACHGGQYDANSGYVSGSTFLPLDPGLIQVTGGTAVRDINKLVMDQLPSPAVANYLRGLYHGDPRSTTGAENPDFVPQGWASQAGLYRQVIKPHCVMCHLGVSSSVDFSSADGFLRSKAQIYSAVCTARSMPHAEFPFNNFWTKDTGPFFLPGVFAGALGYQSCP